MQDEIASVALRAARPGTSYYGGIDIMSGFRYTCVIVTWEIVFYTTAAEYSPVRAFIDSLPEPQQAKILRGVLLLQENGTALREPSVKPLGDGLWELRTVFGGEAFRIIYFTWTGRRFVLLHAFQKKTQKTPPGEIDLARGRRADWLARHKETP